MVKKEKDLKQNKKPIYKKWWFWLIIAFVGVPILLVVIVFIVALVSVIFEDAGNTTRTRGATEAIDFSKLTLAEAETWCKENARRYCDIKAEYSEDIPEGELISQNFQKGEPITGDIKVRYSSGLIEVPDFTTITVHQTWCNNNDMECNIVRQYSEGVANNRLISQSVEAGSRIAKGTVIDLIFSGSPIIDREKYDQIQNGMSETQVWTIISAKCEAGAESGSGSFHTVIYTCKGSTYSRNGANAVLTFQGGRLTGKAQLGL